MRATKGSEYHVKASLFASSHLAGIALTPISRHCTVCTSGIDVAVLSRDLIVYGNAAEQDVLVHYQIFVFVVLVNDGIIIPMFGTAH